VPIAAAALAIAWRRIPRTAAVAAAVVLAALTLDASFPAVHDASEFAASVNARAAELERRLGALADDGRLHRILYPAGGEAEPEAPFVVIAEAWRSLPFRVDALVLVDEHALPVAWTGPMARLPVHLRLLGERTVAAEPGVGSVWLWWRESVFESGRPIGSLLAGVELPEDGSRSVLGAWRAGPPRPTRALEGWDRRSRPAPRLRSAWRCGRCGRCHGLRRAWRSSW